jgi:hypothetical protein
VVYRPDFSVQLNVNIDAYPQLGEWAIVRDGTHRGGIAIAHGCFRIDPCDTDDVIDRCVEELRDQLMGYLAGAFGLQLSFGDPQQP